MNDFSFLTQSLVFKGLTANEISILFASLPYRIRKFRAGAHVAASGEQVNSLLIVVSGTVKGEMTDYAGRVIKIEDIPASGVLAAAFIFGNRNVFPVTVVALTDIEILVIGREDFMNLMLKDRRILQNFLDMISNRSQFLSEKIKFLNFKTIKGKLAQYILQLSGGKKGTVRFTKTQGDLADFFGVARPSVARTIREMEEEGLISARGKEVSVLDEKRLREVSIE